MKSETSTKLTVQLQEVGAEKPTKQTIGNIIDNPGEAKILELGEAVASFAPESATLTSVIETVQNEYVK